MSVFVCHSIFQYTCLYLFLSVSLSVSFPICMYVCLLASQLYWSVCLSTCVLVPYYICLYVRPSVCLSFHLTLQALYSLSITLMLSTVRCSAFESLSLVFSRLFKDVFASSFAGVGGGSFQRQSAENDTTISVGFKLSTTKCWSRKNLNKHVHFHLLTDQKPEMFWML